MELNIQKVTTKVTCVGWAKLIFSDGRTNDSWTDKRDSRNSDVDSPSMKSFETKNMCGFYPGI